MREEAGALLISCCMFGLVILGVIISILQAV